MKGNKIDFYAANLKAKLALFIKKPSYIGFYFDRFRKYSDTKSFETFIISYPKSGRTWMQKLIIESVKLHKQSNFDLADVSKLSEQSVDFPTMLSTHAGSSWEEIVKDEEGIKNDDIASYEHAKIIYLYRDPRDVMVSQYYHILHRSGYNTFKKEYLIDNRNVGLLKIINFMNKWARYTQSHKDLILPIAYEELKENTNSHISSLFGHINYDMDEENIEKAIEHCTLEKMRNREADKQKNPWLHKNEKNQDPNSFHFRKGISGEYKSFFSQEQIAHINKVIKENLDPFYSSYIC